MLRQLVQILVLNGNEVLDSCKPVLVNGISRSVIDANPRES